MTSKSRPIELFVSYAHEDRKYLTKLRAHLAGLESDGRVHCWWDGAIKPGDPWEAQLLDALQRANVVVLLLTSSFVASQYCIEKELAGARERERLGQVDLLPIWVDEFDIGAHWIGTLQAITVDGKPVVQSRLGSAAWAHVARHVRLKIECMEGRRPVMHALNQVEEVVNSGDMPLQALPSHKRAAAARFATVSAFWKAESTLLSELDLVTVPGTFSQFAPMLMGRPRSKRVLHREFRRAIEINRGFGELKRLTINACMSISSGQMVHREVRQQSKRLLGLYESIVRNGIPVFVLPDYYEQELVPAIRETSGSGCYEAEVTGQPFLLDNTYIRHFLSRQGLDRILPAFVINDLCRDAYALEVGGPGTTIRRLEDQPVRYLDGDIWLATSSDGTERFHTAYVDISNETERQEEMYRLRQEAGDDNIIATWDQVQSIEQWLAAAQSLGTP